MAALRRGLKDLLAFPDYQALLMPRHTSLVPNHSLFRFSALQRLRQQGETQAPSHPPPTHNHSLTLYPLSMWAQVGLGEQDWAGRAGTQQTPSQITAWASDGPITNLKEETSE